MSLRSRIRVLWALTGLFFLRVAGQLLVMLGVAPLLPPPDAWYSGLLPYPLLLPAQCLILAAQVKFNADAARSGARFSNLKTTTARGLVIASAVYAVAMAVRYALTRTHEIPVAFHFVLAGYLYMLGRLHQAKGATGV